jgi:hypothetical protein
VTKDHDSRSRATTWIRWIARIWSAPIIIYALMMFVGYTWSWITTGVADPHAVEDYPPIENLPPIFLFLSVVGLALAWRWERLGGAITLGFLLATLALLLILTPIMRDFPRSAMPYLLVLIVAVPGALFLVCWRRSRGGTTPDDSA